VGAWQLRRAGELKDVSLFTWLDPDSEADPPELAQVIHKGDHRFDQRQPFSDLRTTLLERAAGRARQKETAAMARGLSVVIAYCEEDRPSVSSIKQHLQQKHGFQVQLARPPPTAAGSETGSTRRCSGSGELFCAFIRCSPLDGVRYLVSHKGTKPGVLTNPLLELEVLR
jgi:hypothetical protein